MFQENSLKGKSLLGKAAIALLSVSTIALNTSYKPVAAAGTPVLSNGSTTLSNPQTLIAQASLSGVYRCNDGGTYYFRQVGNQVWWFGESGDGGGTWSNIFKGTIQGTQIRGEWIDVPKGSIQSGGIMVIRQVSPGKFIAIQRTGGFGGSEWTRQ